MFDPTESPADIIKRVREERANRSYYQDQGTRIDPLVIYENAANKEKDIGPDPETPLVPKVDPINYLRDIAGQITVNRAKEAGLDVPRTLAEAFPERARPSLSDISKKYGQFATFGHRDYQAAKDVGYSDDEILGYLNADMSRLHPDNKPGGSAGLYEEIKKGNVDLSKAVNIVR